MSKKISEQTIRRMKPPQAGNRIEWDSQLPGFGVRITAEAVISFVLNYRFANRQHRYTIGRWPELTATAARDEALNLKQLIRQGVDPLEEKRALGNEPTFADLIDDYLKSGEFLKKRESTARDYRRMALTILKPKLGKLRLKAVDKRDIEKLHAAMQKTPYAANRCLALISVLFNYAMEAEWVTANPAVKVERYPEDERTRYLKKDEIERFAASLDSYHDQAAANALRLLLFTGARLSEVLKAEWSQFDLERRVWIKSSHHVKQKRQSETPLIEAAVDLLQGIRRKLLRKKMGISGPLFVGADGKKARVTIRRPWIQALKAADLVEVVEVVGKRGKPLKRYKPTVRLHDLRHSFVSHLVLSGVSLKAAGALVGHTQVATTNRYANLTRDDLREAADRFSKVIEIPKRSA